MRRPLELDTGTAGSPRASSPDDLWAALRAADAGDPVALRAVLAREARVTTAEVHGTRALHLAVRRGHAAGTRR